MASATASDATLEDDKAASVKDVNEAKEDVEKAPSAPSAAPASDDLPIDGGYTAWAVVVGGFCVLFCAFGWINTSGVFETHYQNNQLRDSTPSAISWILTLQPFLLFAGGMVVGKTVDNFGPRWPLLAGSFLHVFGVMMLSISSKYYQILLSQGICSPLGLSLIFYPSVTACMTWFREKRALAIGIVSSGGSIGAVIFPIMFTNIVDKVGFGWTVRIMGFMMLALLVVANVTTVARNKPIARPASLEDYFGPFREPPFVALFAACGLGYFSLFVPINFLTTQAKEGGVDPKVVGYLLAILNAGSFPGRLFPGWVGDNIGRYNVILIMVLFTALTSLVIWIPGTAEAPHSTAVYVIYSLLYGFGSGALVSLVPALLGQISPDVTKLGVRQGVLFFGIAIASLVGSPIAGAILKSNGGAFWGLEVWTGVMMLASAFLFGVCRVLLGGFKVMVKV